MSDISELVSSTESDLPSRLVSDEPARPRGESKVRAEAEVDDCSRRRRLENLEDVVGRLDVLAMLDPLLLSDARLLTAANTEVDVDAVPGLVGLARPAFVEVRLTFARIL